MELGCVVVITMGVVILLYIVQVYFGQVQQTLWSNWNIIYWFEQDQDNRKRRSDKLGFAQTSRGYRCP